jgi:hypothetical protein
MTNLSAGGLRNATTLATAYRTKGASASRLGTDAADRLETAEREHAGANFRQTSTTVLGLEPSRSNGVE